MTGRCQEHGTLGEDHLGWTGQHVRRAPGSNTFGALGTKREASVFGVEKGWGRVGKRKTEVGKDQIQQAFWWNLIPIIMAIPKEFAF